MYIHVECEDQPLHSHSLGSEVPDQTAPLCASVQSDQGLLCPQTESVNTKDYNDHYCIKSSVARN